MLAIEKVLANIIIEFIFTKFTENYNIDNDHANKLYGHVFLESIFDLLSAISNLPSTVKDDFMKRFRIVS